MLRRNWQYIYSGMVYCFFCLKSFKRPSKNKAVYVAIKSNCYRRYLYVLLKFFHSEGYAIFLKKDLRLFHALRTEQYVSFLFSEKIPTLGKPPNKTRCIIINDDNLSPDFFVISENTNTQQHFHVPMCQHPLMYNKGWWNKPFEQVKRKHSIFMAGNFDKEAYSPIIQDQVFDVLSRTQVYEYLDKNGLLYKVEKLADLQLFLEEPLDRKIILLNRLLVDVPMNKLRDLLGKFSFYFALPGVVMPYSHNIIEAMSCGCIPFIQEQYAAMFIPPLVNGKHVITFSSLYDIEEKMDSLFHLTDTDTENMSNSVTRYYEDYLTPSSVVNAIETKAPEIIYLQAEHFSVELLKSRIEVTDSSNKIKE